MENVDVTYPLKLVHMGYLTIEANYPIVCAVLALDSWNYCSGE